jgi:hypothetical protein
VFQKGKQFLPLKGHSVVLLIYTVKSGESIGSDRGKKTSSSKVTYSRRDMAENGLFDIKKNNLSLALI